MQEVLQALTQDGLAAVMGSEGNGPAAYMYALTQKGLDRAESAFARSGYAGPAPVPLREYVARINEQSVGETTVTREQVLRALGGLVLAEHTVTRIGRAAASRKSTLIHGPSGNGKTTVVRAIGAAVEGTMYIPYAIEMVGQIVHLYDPSKHQLVPEDLDHSGGLLKVRPDRRWVHIRRPMIWAGGELTRHSLELVYDDNTKVYEAPLQLKANGGTLIIDDFGRQQMPAVQLLNRWIVALEGGVDHLTLHTGQTIEVPFDVLVLFSTNLPPERLADEAFLRRIRYKVELPNPTRDEYRAIFRQECAARGLDYSDDAVTHLLAQWYDGHNRELRGCHPRDIVEAVVDAAEYEETTARINTVSLDEACTTYFLRPMNAPS
jgi:predicted ATPase with chaperone activity